MEYKITTRNQLSALSGIITFTIFIIIGVGLLGINEGFENDLFTFFSIFYLINFLLVLFIHYQYYKTNKNTELEIDIERKQLKFKTYNNIKIINFNEIQNIEINMVPSMYRRSNFQILPFEPYHYAVINTFKNEKIIVSCLLIKNLADVFNDLDITVIRNRCLYPNIKQTSR
jgi:hypothetical protein